MQGWKAIPTWDHGVYFGPAAVPRTAAQLQQCKAAALLLRLLLAVPSASCKQDAKATPR